MLIHLIDIFATAGVHPSHRVSAGQIPPFFLPRVRPQLGPRDLTSRKILTFFLPHVRPQLGPRDLTGRKIPPFVLPLVRL